MVYTVNLRQPCLNTRTTAVEDAALKGYTSELKGSTQSMSFAESIWLE